MFSSSFQSQFMQYISVFPILPRTVRAALIFGSVLFSPPLQLSISTDGIDQSPSQLAYIAALATQYLNGRQIFDY